MQYPLASFTEFRLTISLKTCFKHCKLSILMFFRQMNNEIPDAKIEMSYGIWNRNRDLDPRGLPGPPIWPLTVIPADMPHDLPKSLTARTTSSCTKLKHMAIRPIPIRMYNEHAQRLSSSWLKVRALRPTGIRSPNPMVPRLVKQK